MQQSHEQSIIIFLLGNFTHPVVLNSFLLNTMRVVEICRDFSDFVAGGAWSQAMNWNFLWHFDTGKNFSGLMEGDVRPQFCSSGP